MPDLHIFCKDRGEASEIFLQVHKKIYEEIEKAGRDYVSLYNLTSREFFFSNQQFFIDLINREKKPVLLCFYPEGTKYYWLLNIEYHIVDRDGRPREIGTVQMDIGNAERFGISYTDKDGKRKYPVILHTAIVGSVERWLYTVFDTALGKKPPSLPVWLSPVQARFIPVGERFIEFSLKISEQLTSHGFRSDVDDRAFTVSKKIREAEASWIPYSILVGEKEVNSDILSVRARTRNSIREMSVADLVREIEEETTGYPRRTLGLPELVSRRPLY